MVPGGVPGAQVPDISVIPVTANANGILQNATAAGALGSAIIVTEGGRFEQYRVSPSCLAAGISAVPAGELNIRAFLPG